MNQSKNYYRRWLVQSALGLVVSSAGLCMVIEAGIWKSQSATAWQWVIAGTFALVVFNAGLCILIDSLRFRMLHDQSK
ncbi:MAG: hypothetical protein HC892_06485 [Saprospiraceae bacterium]|nr:hypothetical protein [Saprospiraceae bacterium]